MSSMENESERQYLILKGLHHPVTIGLALAIATFSSCKCMGKSLDKCRAFFLILSRETAAAKRTLLFHIDRWISSRSASL